jgi:hypothetical protein
LSRLKIYIKTQTTPANNIKIQSILTVPTTPTLDQAAHYIEVLGFISDKGHLKGEVIVDV